MKTNLDPVFLSTINQQEFTPKNFFSININTVAEQYSSFPPDYWQALGFENALRLFYQAAERVPAYKDFLEKEKINPQQIKTFHDFQNVPIINKKNYLRAYSLKDLCWNGDLKNSYILSSSSGSTGEPFLWPRGEEQELEIAINMEFIFSKIFKAHQFTTLYINCFAMGTWIAGPVCLAGAEYLSRKGYPILTVTPGIDKEVALSLFKNLAGQFDQVVISGYPPFVKDLLDAGESFGINWKSHQIKFLFAAEGFSEQWRNYVLEKAGTNDLFCTSVNIYGSADAVNLGNETPLTTYARRIINSDLALCEKVFGDSRLPTLCQYDPRLKFFEEVNRQVIFTTRAGLPLVRYSIGDTGGVIDFDTLNNKLLDEGYDLKDGMVKKGLEEFYWKIPFVYVFGRSDLTISLYGLLIYPEHIKTALEDPDLTHQITGKFVMSIEVDEHQDQFMRLRIELKSGVKPDFALSDTINKRVVTTLRKINSEYSRLYQTMEDRIAPLVDLIQQGDVNYFKQGIKQRWVEKP